MSMFRINKMSFFWQKKKKKRFKNKMNIKNKKE